MTSRKENVDFIRGMALQAAAAVANGEGVRTEAEEDFDREQLKVRVFIGERSARFTVNNVDVDYVQSDGAVRRKVERLIRDELAQIG